MGIKIARIRIRAVSQQKRGSVTIAGLSGIVQQLYRRLTDLCVWTRPGSEKGSLYRDQHELVFVFTNGKDPASPLQRGWAESRSRPRDAYRAPRTLLLRGKPCSGIGKCLRRMMRSVAGTGREGFNGIGISRTISLRQNAAKLKWRRRSCFG